MNQNKENVFDQKATTWDDNPRRIKMVEKVVGSLRESIDFSKELKLLDYGCGTGLLGMSFIEEVAEVTFCDTSKGMLEQVAKKVEYYQHKNAAIINADFNELSSIPTGFDVIFSMLVLHHVPEISKLIAKFNQALKTGGKFVWIDLDKEDGSFHNDESIPHFGFSKARIEQLLAGNNFKITKYDLDTLQIKKEIEEKIVPFKAFITIAEKR